MTLLFSPFATWNISQAVADSNRSTEPESPLLPSAYTYKLPFEAGKSYLIRRGGSSHNNSYDFVMDEGTEVRAVIGGVIEAARDVDDCQSYDPKKPKYNKDCIGNIIRIKQDDGNYGFYIHLKKGGALVKSGKVIQGQLIALSGSTGYASGPHLHYDMSKDSKNDSRLLVHFTEAPQNNSTLSGEFIPSPISQNYSCPLNAGNDVIVYKVPNYKCGEKNEHEGYEKFTVADGQPHPLPAAVDASSIYIPPNRYVILRPKNNLNGFVLRCNSDNDFTSDKVLVVSFVWGIIPVFDLIPLNDNVSTIEVHSGACTINFPPNTKPEPVALQSPPNASLSTVASASAINIPQKSVASTSAFTNIAPTLCWQSMGDIDGDELKFYVEVTGETANANSSWQAGVCWHPSQLDYKYGSYFWRVKAKDSRGAESGWSDTWAFVIESPNHAPSVTLDSSNGSTASSINSRDTTWAFTGIASDPEGYLDRVEFRCNGDACGSQSSHSNGNNWSHTQNSMSGQNEIYFAAFDDLNQYTYSRRITLYIDLAAPATTAGLNGESNSTNWPTWFTAPVQVRLNAQDGATGRARVGVRDMHYRLDGGVWQIQSGDTATFNVTADGTYTVEYYAVDKLDNRETQKSITFRIDQTPPTPPSGATEINGIANNQWQNVRNTPTLTWAASTDATSGVWGYQMYFGLDSNGVAYNNFPANVARQWTPLPAGVPTGVYYLRGRTRDNAGNWSVWTPLFTFKYDGTPPENPTGITHTSGITSTVWQRLTNLADFHWPVPHDEGSGIQGYYAYWGLNPSGVISQLITTNAYTSATPACALNAACTGYFRLRSVDNVGNVADDWSTAFILNYDNVPPTVDFTFNGGLTQTAQTEIILNISASDQGSGVKAMRFSTDGQTWTSWEAFATERSWTIPAISRQFWPIYVQVKDGVDLESTVVAHNIYLEVNRGQPHSDNFRLFDSNNSSGASPYTSTLYTGRGTIGQLADTAALTSTSFSIQLGYEAGSAANPIVDPGYETFNFTNGVMASGGGTLTSTLFSMQTNVGEFGLPNNETVLVSAHFNLQPGFLAAQPSPLVLPTPESGPAPTPEPPLACEIPSVRINNGASFTNILSVSLNLCAPHATVMLLSSAEDLSGATWEPYATTRNWVLPDAGQFTAPRFIYAVFKDADGTVHGVYMDDIIYDPNLPSGELLVGNTVPISPATSLRPATFDNIGKNILYVDGQPYAHADASSNGRLVPVLHSSADGSVNIFVNGNDDNSGLSEMQFSASPAFTDTLPEPFSPVKTWTPTDGDGYKTVYARFFDNAGNISSDKQVNFVYDITPPYGWVGFESYVVPASAVTVTVYLAADDGSEYDEYEDGGIIPNAYAGTVSDMRLSTTSDFSTSIWEPYTDTLILPRTVTNTDPFVLYAQYRDLAGNVSDVYSATYQIDDVPPTVYVQVPIGSVLTRTITTAAYDDLSGVSTLHISNDPLMQENVVTLPYIDTVDWVFDDRRVVWVQAEDGVGNVSDPYPAYAESIVYRVYLPIVTRD